MVSTVLEITVPVLYGISMVVLSVYGTNLLILSWWRVRREGLRPGFPDEYAGEIDCPAHRKTLTAAPEACPRVTIQLPLFNEPLVVDRLLRAVSQIDWPTESLQIQILDDSTDHTPEVVERHLYLFRDRGIQVTHIRRDNRQGYKAGALQGGLKSARGEFIAIFDADFVPPRDFLHRILPAFDQPDVGMVQGRWGHLNQDQSLLTRVQSFGLDTHFALEQAERSEAGCFINFNGTAGVWRKSCISSAGGWQGDTLTEDLDLSYRAQMKGWRFKFLKRLEVAAELPVSLNAFRAQQHRWTKGGLETARKLLTKLWISDVAPLAKWEGTVHLTANIVFPFIVIAALLHAPLVLMEAAGIGPGNLYFGAMSVGLVGFAGFYIAQVVAQRELYADWVSRLRIFPAFMAGSIGMALNNSRAVWEILRGRVTEFVRTPKFSLEHTRKRPWWKLPYANLDIPGVAVAEVLLALYCLGGLGAIVSAAEWAAVPFQALFAAGFLFISVVNVQQFQLRRRG